MERKAFGLTDIGLVRTNNEDSILVMDYGMGKLSNLYAVADGMGGHNAGETASSSAIGFLRGYIENHADDAKYIEGLLAEAVSFANLEVYGMAQNDEKLKGMGTTMTVCCVDNINAYFAHVGDSRLYKISEKKITQITEDHSLVSEMMKTGRLTAEQAKSHPNRNVITRALGTDPELVVDSGFTPLDENEFVLICSDGLTTMVSDELIKSIVTKKELDVSERAAALINEAKKNGGADNISVVLI